MLHIHENIKKQLDHFLNNNTIPNIIFHGPSGSGKLTLVGNFIDKIYKYKNDVINNFTMTVNCAHGKGIKFIREDLKLFAKINIPAKYELSFKTIILLNADKLTIDAQSALRRCIELFSHTTRFFIIIEDKVKLLKPILSRFSDIYVSLPVINNKEVNLHKYNLNSSLQTAINSKKKWLYKNLNELNEGTTDKHINNLSVKLYDKGYSGIDLINFIKEKLNTTEQQRYSVLLFIRKIKEEFRNEKILMFFIMKLILIRSTSTLENVLFM